MSNDLMCFPSEKEFSMMQVMAQNASASGLYAATVGAECKILMILLTAREMGISPMRALNGGLHNIKGRIEISGRLMNAMIRKAGHRLTTIEINNKICIIEGQRGDSGEIERAQFSVQDARDADLLRKDNWRSFTEDMLYTRALSRLCRRLFPDVISEAYSESEIPVDEKKKINNTKQVNPDDLPVENFEMVVENSVELISNFCSRYPEEDKEYVKEYLLGYSEHWKKSITLTVEENHEAKFIADFAKWKKKHKPEPLKIVQVEIEEVVEDFEEMETYIL